LAAANSDLEIIMGFRGIPSSLTENGWLQPTFPRKKTQNSHETSDDIPNMKVSWDSGESRRIFIK